MYISVAYPRPLAAGRRPAPPAGGQCHKASASGRRPVARDAVAFAAAQQPVGQPAPKKIATNFSNFHIDSCTLTAHLLF